MKRLLHLLEGAAVSGLFFALVAKLSGVGLTHWVKMREHVAPAFDMTAPYCNRTTQRYWQGGSDG